MSTAIPSFPIPQWNWKLKFNLAYWLLKQHVCKTGKAKQAFYLFNTTWWWYQAAICWLHKVYYWCTIIAETIKWIALSLFSPCNYCNATQKQTLSFSMRCSPIYIMRTATEGFFFTSLCNNKLPLVYYIVYFPCDVPRHPCKQIHRTVYQLLKNIVLSYWNELNVLNVHHSVHWRKAIVKHPLYQMFLLFIQKSCLQYYY